MEKQDYEKLSEYLEKAIEKDTLNPTAFYLTSLMHMIDSCPYYDVNKGYMSIITAIRQYQVLDEKEIEKLKKDNIFPITLQVQKEKVDSAAYYISRSTHTVQAYEDFLQKYTSANLRDSAIFHRNILAFTAAKREDSFEAYRKFLDTYPEADQVKMAERLYNQRLFEAKTKDKTLSNYENFLRQFPETPFRPQLENEIFEMLTVENKIEDYLSFLEKYPKSKTVKKATDFLYYRLVNDSTQQDDIWSTLPDNQYCDSLRLINPVANSVYIPVLIDGNYQFINVWGNPQPQLAFKLPVDQNYWCNGTEDDFIFTHNDTIASFYNKLGALAWHGKAQHFEKLTSGIIKIYNGQFQGIIHAAGWELIPADFDEISLLGDHYFQVTMNGKKGLYSLAGREILSPEYDRIIIEGEFVVLENEGLLAITNHKKLDQKVKEDRISNDFRFHDYEPISSEYLLVIKDDEEALLDQNLEIRIEFDQHKIYEKEYGWISTGDSLIRYYRPDFTKYYERPFENIISRNGLDAVKWDDQWFLIRSGTFGVDVINYDSLYVGHEDVTYSEKHQYLSLLFDNNVEIEVATHQNVRFFYTQNNVENLNPSTFAVIIDPRRRTQTIYDTKGNLRFSLRNEEIESVSDSLFVVESKGRKGIVNSSGKEVMPIRFQAIAKQSSGHFSLLQNNKFGMFDPQKDWSFPARYDKQLEYYNDSLLIASEEEKFGLIDHRSENVLPFAYDGLHYWSDSLVLVKNDKYWQLITIDEQAIVLDNILTFEEFGTEANRNAVVFTLDGFGVINSVKGIVIKPTFTDLYPIGTDEEYIYFCEKYVSEAEIYVVVYYDREGKRLEYHVYEVDEYQRIYCDR